MSASDRLQIRVLAEQPMPAHPVALTLDSSNRLYVVETHAFKDGFRPKSRQIPRGQSMSLPSSCHEEPHRLSGARMAQRSGRDYDRGVGTDLDIDQRTVNVPWSL